MSEQFCSDSQASVHSDLTINNSLNTVILVIIS